MAVLLKWPPLCSFLLFKLRSLLQAISVGVPVVAGFLVSFLGQKEILTWYRGLNKPKWQPPAFLFGKHITPHPSPSDSATL